MPGALSDEELKKLSPEERITYLEELQKTRQQDIKELEHRLKVEVEETKEELKDAQQEARRQLDENLTRLLNSLQRVEEQQQQDNLESMAQGQQSTQAAQEQTQQPTAHVEYERVHNEEPITGQQPQEHYQSTPQSTYQHTKAVEDQEELEDQDRIRKYKGEVMF